MSRFAVIFALAAALAVPATHAADAVPLTYKEKQDSWGKGRDNYYVGVGMFDDLMNVNFEAVTHAGNFIVRGGRFKSNNTGLAVNVGWRKPLAGGDPHQSGYFAGVFAGQVLGDSIGAKNFQRVGGGADLGYHWVNDSTRKEVSVGLGTAQPETYGTRKLDSVPTIFFDFVISLGF